MSRWRARCTGLICANATRAGQNDVRKGKTRAIAGRSSEFRVILLRYCMLKLPRLGSCVCVMRMSPAWYVLGAASTRGGHTIAKWIHRRAYRSIAAYTMLPRRVRKSFWYYGRPKADQQRASLAAPLGSSTCQSCFRPVDGRLALTG